MPVTKAQIKANQKYEAKAYDRFNVRFKKGQKQKYEAQAKAKGLSLNAYIIKQLEQEQPEQ